MAKNDKRNLNNVGMNSDSAQNEFQSMYARSGQSDLNDAISKNQQSAQNSKSAGQSTSQSNNSLQQARQSNQLSAQNAKQNSSQSGMNSDLQHSRQANQLSSQSTDNTTFSSSQNQAGLNSVQTQGSNQSTMETINQDPQMKQYFDTLPKSVQETILQSGTQVQSLDQLKSIAENFSSGNSTDAQG